MAVVEERDGMTGGSSLATEPLYLDGVQGSAVIAAAATSVWTVDQIANQLAFGYWGGAKHAWDLSAGGRSIWFDVSALTASGQAHARAALDLWADVTGIRFIDMPGSSGSNGIKFDDDQEGAFTSTQFSFGRIQSATINISRDWIAGSSGNLNSYAFQTYVHEIGHALGLGHAGDYNETATYGVDAKYLNDGWPMTIMSYFDQRENTYFSGQNYSFNFVTTPQLADIAATVLLYGMPTSTRLGDTVYGFNSTAGRAVFDATKYASVSYTIIDSGGTDTLDYSGFSANQLIDLRPANFSNVGSSIGNVAIAIGTTIENAVGGSGDDRIIGNDVGNAINGGPGNDVLEGRSGNDLLTGGPGADVLSGGTGVDTLFGGDGQDLFTDLMVNFSGDTIGDLTTADAIVLSDASLPSFQFSLVGKVLSFIGGTITFSNSLGGPLVANTASTGGVKLTLAKQFADPTGILVSNFAVGAGGWSTQDLYPRHIADVNGDGFGDIVGFGSQGVLVSYGAALSGFTPAKMATGHFGSNTGWISDNLFYRELADINGDGRADIIGFGIAGTLTAIAKADGSFADPVTGLLDFGINQGWTTQEGFARATGDVNGDGKADLIGFGSAGTLVALGKGDGTFQETRFSLADYGVRQGWTSDNSFRRMLADVNGDGSDDIVGFGYAGALVSLSNGDGTFTSARLILNNFGLQQGWSSQNSFSRDIADVNGDGFADIVGFGAAGTYVAYGTANGTFSEARLDVENFAAKQGWTNDAIYHRELADINGDGRIDVVGFGAAGVLAGVNQGHWLA
ncbi:M10 family metallopeptidase C-terminal domain-containing protein [Sphingomonas glaciei]|uniref:M10 family metallopeptidase C-terminal domain-containing protein n=1 Tax=Sphingomonas glaciei TaxID=2938948 RepID=A0ABY5N0U8_9SPHN|nr:M10 family metallopeptidase C-terminal domain-containing protein [Sphingomonas glaciei]UUR08221.1 M10 family metallopeptidase C-terminal domain-containing protein [Sphingomonas glaciei]